MEMQKVSLKYLGHSGFLIKYNNNEHTQTIAIDPYNITEIPDKADFILITHSHYDHCSIKDIQKLIKSNTTLVIPADVQSKITKLSNIRMEVVEAGEGIDTGIIKIEAFPAYNTNKKFHTKNDGWLGYLVKIGETIIYHAGDTDIIPEHDKLTGYAKQGNTFIALLPVSGQYVMTPQEAASLAKRLNPTLAIPMHFGTEVSGTKEDAELFVAICKENKIEAKILDKLS
jgi:L-ascorbate metabolism protein UlaG (beta-lactamase superfamily)